ncbi:MAG: carbohydrate ABC transporter permease [Firmicutes bacterium]|nr:carbohydrate ABC transporter permease [Bacillota bacterium]
MVMVPVKNVVTGRVVNVAMDDRRPRPPVWIKMRKTVGLVFLSIFALFFLAPLFWIIYVSFVPKIYIFMVPPVIFTDFFGTIKSFNLNSFALAFGSEWKVGFSFINSIVITASSIILTMIVCSLCAYAFAFMNFPGRDVLFVMILATMMLPMTTMIAPYYRVLRTYGLLNTRLGLIIPYAASAFSVFLLRQYFVRLPMALVEAAIIDGASRFRVWWQIILPLSKPALITLAIYQFRQIWNDFLIPMIVLRDERLFTFPLKLQFMSSVTVKFPWDAMMATGCIAILVPFILFLIYQRYFMEGLSGSIKG